MVVSENEEVKAAFEEKALYRKVLIGTKTYYGVTIKDVGDHSCNHMKESGKPLDVVAAVLKK